MVMPGIVYLRRNSETIYCQWSPSPRDFTTQDAGFHAGINISHGIREVYRRYGSPEGIVNIRALRDRLSVYGGEEG